MIERLAKVIYWTCCGVALLFLLGAVAEVVLYLANGTGDGMGWIAVPITFFIGAVIYGIGLGIHYVLAASPFKRSLNRAVKAVSSVETSLPQSVTLHRSDVNGPERRPIRASRLVRPSSIRTQSRGGNFGRAAVNIAASAMGFAIAYCAIYLVRSHQSEGATVPIVYVSDYLKACSSSDVLQQAECAGFFTAVVRTAVDIGQAVPAAKFFCIDPSFPMATLIAQADADLANAGDLTGPKTTAGSAIIDVVRNRHPCPA